MSMRDEARSVPPPNPQESLTGRIPALDSIRAMGAVAVGLWHLYVTLPHEQQMSLAWIMFTPVRLIHPTVIIFFMLSGFVLSLPYHESRSPPAGRFLVRRMSRLYIPFVFVVGGAYILYALTGTRPDFIDSITFRSGDMPHGFTVTMFLRALLMTGLRRDDLVDPALWTLVHEVRISLIFPLLMLLCRRTWVGVSLMALCYVFVWRTQDTVGRFITFPALTDDYLTTFLTTLYFIPCFMFGIYLARYREPIVAWLEALGGGWRALLWVFVLVNFCFLPDYDIRQPFTEIGASLFIMLILSSARLSRVLCAAVLQWLGKISYSLYLIHLPILFVLRHLMDGHTSLTVTYLVYVLITPPLATVMQRFVEQPSIAFGKRLAQRA